MDRQPTIPSAVVSVIIPCYNHGNYLTEAVESIYQQGYSPVEIIVVDDGSSDNTKDIAARLKGVQYVYQQNQGLSAARNTGIRHATGEFIIFLDADDWLLPGAITTNLRYLQQNPKAAFVSGAHDKVFVDTNTVREERSEVTQDHYAHLMQGNYIGMHATVMYRRWVFNEFQYDTSLRSCEDYDLYLKITRKYPVVHHGEKIAAYRLHNSNMSGNIPFMLSMALAVLDRQQQQLKTSKEKEAFRRGHGIWKEYYTKELYQKLRAGKAPANKASLLTLLKYQPLLLCKYLLTKVIP
ncbi:family 2 glycosyl transferase [Flammeovirgaceae bacterium 311]|nr:family 2 glycosyl transferase [Flammeovirgaceae bacterium 311]